jgi:hypothetical protein
MNLIISVIVTTTTTAAAANVPHPHPHLPPLQPTADALPAASMSTITAASIFMKSASFS